VALATFSGLVAVAMVVALFTVVVHRTLPPGRALLRVLSVVAEPVDSPPGRCNARSSPDRIQPPPSWLCPRGDLQARRSHMTDQPANDQLQSFDSNAMPWGELYIEQLQLGVPLKAFISDPDTGMSVQMIRYDAGFTNPWHRHNCAHGIYVLEGTLRTHAGNFGPGSFVWFPEGMLMEHGATDDAAVTTLFITNKPFDIRYAFEDEQDNSTGS
jgi:quercetin dioxygenase-like cupin family protein